MKEYTIQTPSGETTVLLSDEDAKKYNATPVEKAKKPANKQAAPANKSSASEKRDAAVSKAMNKPRKDDA